MALVLRNPLHQSYPSCGQCHLLICCRCCCRCCCGNVHQPLRQPHTLLTIPFQRLGRFFNPGHEVCSFPRQILLERFLFITNLFVLTVNAIITIVVVVVSVTLSLLFSLGFGNLFLELFFPFQQLLVLGRELLMGLLEWLQTALLIQVFGASLLLLGYRDQVSFLELVVLQQQVLVRHP